MNIKKSLLSALVAMTALTASAQDCCKSNAEVTVFKPTWNVQAQVGAQYTLGELSFGKLISPNAQIAVGYDFTKVFGLRLSLNAWQSKAGIEAGDYFNFVNQMHYPLTSDKKWKWNYIAPMLDARISITNLFGQYNPNRLINAGVIGGIGANIAWGNDEVKEIGHVEFGTQNTGKIWDGTAVRLAGKFGGFVDFRISDNLSAGLEVTANLLDDAYNSKRAGNTDWYYNALAGIKYTFGKPYATKQMCQKNNIDELQAKLAAALAAAEAAKAEAAEAKALAAKALANAKAAPAATAKAATIEPLRRDIFFTIATSKITKEEMVKVMEIADYLKKYPNAKVAITGYADKGTGNAKINQSLSEKRAAIVAETLQKEYGIPASRITTAAKGDTEQPYAVDKLNRVSICVAE